MQGRAVAFFALAASVFATAWSALFVRWAGVPALTAGFWRMLIACLVLWPVLLRSRGVRLPKRSLGWALLSGVCFAGDVGFFNSAVLHGSIGVSTLLTNNFALTYALGQLPSSGSSVVLLATVPVTAVLAAVFFHERLTPVQCLGGLLVLLGVGVVSRDRSRLGEPRASGRRAVC